MKHEPRDTIGDHLALAIKYGAMAQHYWATPWGHERHATYHGKALGHAFRAAELAYDLGQAHGTQSTVSGISRAFNIAEED